MGQYYYPDCKHAPHEGRPCKACAGRAFSEAMRMERGFWRGLRLSGGQPMGSAVDPGDTTDMWKDGD